MPFIPDKPKVSSFTPSGQSAPAPAAPAKQTTASKHPAGIFGIKNKSNIFTRVAGDAKELAAKASERWQKVLDLVEKTNLKSMNPRDVNSPLNPSHGIQAVGELAGIGNEAIGQGVSTAIGEANRAVSHAMSGVNPSKTAEQIRQENKETGNALTGPVIKGASIALKESPVFTTLQKLHDNLKQKYPETAKDVDAIGNVLMLMSNFAGGEGAASAAEAGGAAGTRALKTGAEAALDTASALKTGAKETMAATAESAKSAVNKASEVGTAIAEKAGPKITPKQAVGQVLQGEEKDVAKGIKALAAVDTKDVKTYADLGKKIKAKVKELSSVVDTHLAQEAAPIPLENLAVKQTSKAGKEISTNYVEEALANLQELYSKIADPVKEADVADLLEKAKTAGLTRQEVNNIARQYGNEFGSKAFGKTGEALTSVNAQKFENIRSGLKDTARQGITGEAAKETDETLSALLRTQELVDNTAKAVTKLKQKIRERGLLEKIGHGAFKALDMFSGGFVRGVVGGMLPRGVGYKTLNAIDLEQFLQSNLKLINKAVESGSDKDIQAVMKKLSKAAKEAPKA